MSKQINFDIDSRNFLIALLVIHTVAPQTVLVLPGFVQGLVEYAGFSDKQAGFIASVEFWSMTAGVISMMFLVSRINWRKALTASLLLMIIGNLVSIPVRDFYQFCAVRSLVGYGAGVIVVLSYAFLGMTRKSDRNFGLAIFFVTVYAAAVFPVIPSLFSLGGLTALLIFFTIAATIALPFLRYMPDYGQEHHVVDEHAIEIDWPHKIMALGAMLIFFCANFAVWSYVYRMGIQADLSEQSVGNSLSLSQFFGMAGAFTAALVGARLGRSIPLGIGIAGSIIPLLFLYSTFGAITFTIVIGIYYYAWSMTHPYLLAAMASFDPQGKMVVYATAMQFIGLSMGPALGALVVGEGNYRVVLTWGILLLFVSLVLILPPVRLEAKLVARQ